MSDTRKTKIKSTRTRNRAVVAGASNSKNQVKQTPETSLTVIDFFLHKKKGFKIYSTILSIDSTPFINFIKTPPI